MMFRIIRVINDSVTTMNGYYMITTNNRPVRDDNGPDILSSVFSVRSTNPDVTNIMSWTKRSSTSSCINTTCQSKRIHL